MGKELTLPDEGAFWLKVNKNGSIVREELGPCWEWLGSRTDKGYGYLYCKILGGGLHPERTHRVSWRLTHGGIDADLCVLHKCDNRLCCNPAHLFLGTKGDNIRDCVAKGRTAKGDRNGVGRGEANHNAKLNAVLIKSIRQRAARGESGNSIAKSLHVKPDTIYGVLKGKSYKNVEVL